MISSKYLYCFPKAAAGKVNILNLLNNEVIAVPSRLVEGEPPALAFRLEMLNPRETELLTSKNYLFQDEHGQRDALESYISGLFSCKRQLGLTLVLTYFCNMRCRYCAHKKLIDLPEYLSRDTAEQVVRWTGSMMDELGTESLGVTYYGGEPLMNPRMLKYCAENIARLCRNSGVTYKYDIFTNGTLLTGDMLTQLHDLDVRNMVVTVDGPRDVHNGRRPYKTGGGTYDDVLANLRRAVDMGFNLDVASNLDAQTVEDMEDLILSLREHGLTDKVRFTFGRTSMSFDNADFFDDARDLGVEEFSELWTMSQDLISRHHLKHSQNPARFLMYGFCDYWAPTTFVVMPAGRITKCLGYMNKEDMVLGDVYSGMPKMHRELPQNTDSMLNLFADDCRDCFLLPHCFGGCLFEAKIRGLYPRRPYCQKELLMRGLDLTLDQVG